jgi:hypothetical protein
MTLRPLTLDDLTYADLRRMAVERIPAASGGRWTHHAPVDAGVTILELFAFLLEQQLFVLDQVPDNLVLALLSLLGEAPEDTRTARTVVAPAPGTLTDFVPLPAGSALVPESPALSHLGFSTRQSALFPPVEALEVIADGKPVLSQLVQKRPVPVLTGTGTAAQLAIDITLATPVRAEHAGQPVMLALILDDPGVAAQWTAAAVAVPPPAMLTLDWSDGGAGGRLAGWRDGTGGLRRSGLIGFDIPSAMVGRDRLRLTLATTAATHAEPPRLAALHVGAAIAEHRRRVEIGPEEIGDPDHDAARRALTDQLAAMLPISRQHLDLPDALSPVIAQSVALRLRSTDGGWHDWTPAADLAPVPPEGRRFTVDRPQGRLVFGDGYAGRIPAPATNIALSLDLGGGPEGNHPAGLPWRPPAAAPALRLTSIVAATGGAEAETVDAARDRVAATLNDRHRAVTAEDFVTLVETAPGLPAHRAHVMEGHDPLFPCLTIADSVTVFVVPRTGVGVSAPRADDGALQTLRARLDEARMLTTRVFVARPRIRPVALRLSITAAAGDAASFADRLRPVLAAYLHPATGGPDGTGWPFGRPLRPSELMRVAGAALGPGARIDRVAIRLTDAPGSEEDCTELAIGPAELVALSAVSASVTRAQGAETVL